MKRLLLLGVVNPIFPPSVQKRVQALACYGVMDTEPEPEFDALTKLASQICEAPLAMLTFLDERRQWFKSRVGIAELETPIEHAFCLHAIQSPDEVMVVHDARKDPRFRNNPFVIARPNVRFYAAAPLVTPEGIAIGAVCAVDSKPRWLSPAQRAALRSLSHQAMALLELRRSKMERLRHHAERRRDHDYIRKLQGLLPFCPHCRHERDEETYWQTVDECVRALDEAPLAPEVCAKCHAESLLNGQISGEDSNSEQRRVPQRPPTTSEETSGTNAPIQLSVSSEQVAWLEELSRMRASLQAKEAEIESLRTSEAYFRHLSEYSLDLITILDPDGKIRFESRSIETELGHAPEHYRGRNAFEFVHPEDRGAVMKAFSEALLRHGNTPVVRFRFLHADGSYRVLEGTGNNLLDDPAVGGIVFNSRDVTEHLRLQGEVDRANADKEDTVALLTGGVAHDFNNILTVIQGLAEMTEARLRGTPEAEYLADIRIATNRAAKLTQQLLAISHRVVLQPQVVPLGPWLQSMESRISEILGHNIDLTVAVHGDLPVWEDPTQLEQVFVQLVNNAREAMPTGGHLTIEALPIILGPHQRPMDGQNGDLGYVELTVADQGSGMNEATLNRVFEPFFTTKTIGQHPGLGLPMCRGIVEQSGGHMAVQSHLGRGTIVRLYLPATERVADEAVPPATPLDEGEKPTILLVDDEPMLREIGETILSDSGYHVIVAENGPEALTRLAEMGDTPLGLLLTDVVMPGMNGVQLAAEVERLRPGTPVLLCSGYPRDALALGSGLPPGVTFLPKPFTLAHLLAKVQEILSKVRVLVGN